MKTINDLFELVGKTVEENQKSVSTGVGAHWFVSYSGHVNSMSIKYYFAGWEKDAKADSLDEYLTEDGIQSLYWFIKSRLR